MIYLLFGTMDILIKDYISKIIKDNRIEKININKYNLEDNLKNIILDALTVSLFDEKKLIIINCDNLFSNKKDIDTKILEEYLANPNPNSIVVFVCYTQTVDSRRRIYKLIKEKGKILEFNKNIDIYEYTKKLFSDYHINSDTINLFLKRVGSNPLIIKNEALKLMLFKDEDKLITVDDIKKITSVNNNNNIFELIDFIVNKKKKESIIIYHNLLLSGEEPIKIIVLLANQFRLLYQVKEFTKKGYSEEDIANTLHMKRYPVHLAIQSSYKYDSKVLLKNLENLADLDIKIKTGEVDKSLALELYLLEL